MSRAKPWRHCANDGRGRREVYLNGQPVDNVVWCDTRRGRLIRHCTPLQVVRGALRVEHLRGKVEVVFLG